MNVTSIGDLAQGLVRRDRSAQIKADIARLTREMSTGQISDPARRLRGDYAYLADIEHNLSRLGGYASAAQEAGIFASAAQSAIGKVQTAVGALATDLLSITPTTLDPVRNHASDKARGALDSVVSALNQTVGGRTLFAGTATDRAALHPAAALYTALQAQVAGLPTASAVLAAVDTWFADPAGFAAVMYAGSAQPLAAMETGPGEQVALTLRADDPALRQVLRNVAVAALAADPALGFTPDTQNTLLRAAGEGLLQDQDALTGIRSDLGYAEARIEEAATRNASATTGLELARNTLLAADPYQTATRLQEAQFQLEGLYAVTVRTARLSLLNFLQ